MQLAELIQKSFWESRGLQFPAHQFEAFPTMLSFEEMRMLFAIASNPGLPDGDICDLGAFMGGSTISLAAGVQASGRARIVHSYDRFVFNQKHFEDYLQDHPRLAELESVGFGVELHQQLTREYAAHIQTYVGDFPELPIPENIALLFIDLDKSFELNQAVLAHFDHLVSGAIVVQQDFFFSKTPWTAVTMYRLRDVIPYCGATKANSAIFELRGDLSPHLLTAAAADGMTSDEVRVAYQYFIEQTDRLYHQEILEAALHRFEREPEVRSTHDYAAFAGGAFYRSLLEQKVTGE